MLRPGINSILLITSCCVALGTLQARQLPTNTKAKVNNNNTFRLKKPDYKTSPFTGMTRKHWKDAALYLLSGAFGYINNLDDPMKFPKQPGKSYPRNDGQIPTEKLEGLCRTLFLAAPLLKEDPQLTIHGIKVADYYRHQLGLLVNPASTSYIKRRSKNGGPSQTLVEFGALSVSLFIIPEVLWDPLPQMQKDSLAATMISYGDGPTVPSNWKFFNIFVLSFYKSKGYPVNEQLLVEYLDKSLAHYRGQGWYNDNPAYDYYSMWAFQMYGPLWSEFFGKKYYPTYAKQFLKNFKELSGNYPYMFSRKGEMIMWGRSISYRFGAIIPFPLTGLVQQEGTNYGWLRRISSGAIRQFLDKPEFMEDGIPVLGFYGPFDPAVQAYSCRGSVFWMAKAFLGLLVPENNPFWTAKENEGPWQSQLAKGTVFNNFQSASEILITDYANIGASEVRAWCKVPVIGASEPFRGSENYNRLSYNSAFPWQADGDSGQVAMNYLFKNKENKWEAARLFTFQKFEQGIYYRNLVMETNKNVHLNLADITLPNGILRIDQNTSSDPVDLRLGHYALPVVKGAIKKEVRNIKGHHVQIVSNGVYQLALVSLKGWGGIDVIPTSGLHPEAMESVVMNVSTQATPGAADNVYATLMLWKKAGEKWTEDELVPVKNITADQSAKTITVSFIKGTSKVVRFN